MCSGQKAGRQVDHWRGICGFPHRKGHWTVRALLQNSAALKEFGYSFRHWLRRKCEMLGVAEFPPLDFRRNIMLE